MSQNISGVFQTLSIDPAALAAYRAGRDAMSDQKYQEALAYFGDALAGDDLPDFFVARTLEQRGICHWLLGDYEAAESDFESSIAASDDPNQQARSRNRLGAVAGSCGQYDEARAHYRQTLAQGIALNDLLVSGQANRGLGW